MQQDPPYTPTPPHTHAHVHGKHTHTNKHTHNEEDRRRACNRIYLQTHILLCWLERKKFAAHICSLCTDFYQLDCSVNQSHCGSLGSQREVRAHETEQAQRELERRGWRRESERQKNTTTDMKQKGNRGKRKQLKKTEMEKDNCAAPCSAVRDV